MGMQVYLDNAATTVQKPRAVSRAVRSALRKSGSPGRGGHPPGMIAAELLYSCRALAAELFRVDSPHKIVFTHNATHALNIAIHSIVRSRAFSESHSDGRVLISGYEHNAVLRPLHGLEPTELLRCPSSHLSLSRKSLHKLETEMDHGAGAVVCTHVSNVFGYILPIERVSEICAERGVPLIIDASQSAGCLPVDASKLKAAKFICMPGHLRVS